MKQEAKNLKRQAGGWKSEPSRKGLGGILVSDCRLLVSSFVFILCFLIAPSLFAQSVSLLLTERAAAYEKVAEEIEAGLGNQVRSYDLHNSHQNDEAIESQVKNQKPSLIIALGDKAAFMASERFTQIPILVGMVLELEVESLKRPGIEGVALQIPAQSVLTQLKLILPNLKRVGVLSSGQKYNSFRESIRSTGSGLGLQISEMTVSGKSEIEKQLNENLAGLDAVWLLPDPTIIDSEFLENREPGAGIEKGLGGLFGEFREGRGPLLDLARLSSDGPTVGTPRQEDARPPEREARDQLSRQIQLPDRQLFGAEFKDGPND
jgi:hypothetical protein